MPAKLAKARITSMYYVYVLKCSNETLYVGYTNNLEKRIKRHNTKQVLATKNRTPVEITTYIAFQNKYSAYNFEKYLKSGSGRSFLKRHLI